MVNRHSGASRRAGIDGLILHTNPYTSVLSLGGLVHSAADKGHISNAPCQGCFASTLNHFPYLTIHLSYLCLAYIANLMDISQQENIKIAVLGENCCSVAGLCLQVNPNTPQLSYLTSLLMACQFIHNIWYDFHQYRHEVDSWRKLFTVDGRLSLVELEEVPDTLYSNNSQSHIYQAHSFILIYDATSSTGFDIISRFHELILENDRNKPLSNNIAFCRLLRTKILEAHYTSLEPSFVEGTTHFLHTLQSRH